MVDGTGVSVEAAVGAAAVVTAAPSAVVAGILGPVAELGRGVASVTAVIPPVVIVVPAIRRCEVTVVLPIANFFFIFSYDIQHCFICRPSDSTVPTDAGIEPRTVASGALAVRRSNH